MGAANTGAIVNGVAGCSCSRTNSVSSRISVGARRPTSHSRISGDMFSARACDWEPIEPGGEVVDAVSANAYALNCSNEH